MSWKLSDEGGNGETWMIERAESTKHIKSVLCSVPLCSLFSFPGSYLICDHIEFDFTAIVITILTQIQSGAKQSMFFKMFRYTCITSKNMDWCHMIWTSFWYLFWFFDCFFLCQKLIIWCFWYEKLHQKRSIKTSKWCPHHIIKTHPKACFFQLCLARGGLSTA